MNGSRRYPIRTAELQRVVRAARARVCAGATCAADQGDVHCQHGGASVRWCAAWLPAWRRQCSAATPPCLEETHGLPPWRWRTDESHLRTATSDGRLLPPSRKGHVGNLTCRSHSRCACVPHAAGSPPTARMHAGHACQSRVPHSAGQPLLSDGAYRCPPGTAVVFPRRTRAAPATSNVLRMIRPACILQSIQPSLR
jgi:hypothetical protein